jgi:hypothetical protein
MAIGAEHTNNYVLGRGKIYFDKFTDDVNMILSGERYLGNTPGLNMTSTYQNLDHYSSDYGVRELDDTVQLQLDRSGNFTCDDITMDNVALMFGTEPIDEAQGAATAATEDLTVVLGRYYQLGADDATPDGVGAIENVAVTDGVTPVVATGNYEVDLARGRIHIFPDAVDIDEGDTITVTYDVVAQARELVVDEGTQIEGALRFISDNPKGTDKDYYWPRVRVQASGDYALKGDTWLTMTFNFTVLKKGTMKRTYIREVPVEAAP